MIRTGFLQIVVLSSALCLAGTMGASQDSFTTINGVLDFGTPEQRDPMLPQCGDCTWTHNIPKQNIMNTYECEFPVDNQVYDWQCARYECGPRPDLWYKTVVFGWGSCTYLDETTAPPCPADQCAGGP